MNEYRKSKNETAHYNSFEKMRADMGLSPFSKKTTNQEKLSEQQNNFIGKCRVCGERLHYVDGTNVIVCDNNKCKGIKIKEDFYVGVNRILNDKGAEIANVLFSK